MKNKVSEYNVNNHREDKLKKKLIEELKKASTDTTESLNPKEKSCISQLCFSKCSYICTFMVLRYQYLIFVIKHPNLSTKRCQNIINGRLFHCV